MMEKHRPWSCGNRASECHVPTDRPRFEQFQLSVCFGRMACVDFNRSSLYSIWAVSGDHRAESPSPLSFSCHSRQPIRSRPSCLCVRDFCDTVFRSTTVNRSPFNDALLRQYQVSPLDCLFCLNSPPLFGLPAVFLDSLPERCDMVQVEVHDEYSHLKKPSAD